jgi:hypothetical protein
LCPLIAAPAHANELQGNALSLAAPKGPQPPRLNFRLVADGNGVDRLTQEPLRRSGMIASTEVAPNASLGFGFVRSSPKRSSEMQPGLRATGSRKAAVSFQLKF